MEEQDHTVGTGCVWTDDAGLHHIFYTGINPYLRVPETRGQAVMHATSTDLITWSKDPDRIWYADEGMYERHDWRDPHVFRHPVSGKYYMLLASRQNGGGSAWRGCTGL